MLQKQPYIEELGLTLSGAAHLIHLYFVKDVRVSTQMTMTSILRQQCDIYKSMGNIPAE
jgi:hypothetical protein